MISTIFDFLKCLKLPFTRLIEMTCLFNLLPANPINIVFIFCVIASFGIIYGLYISQYCSQLQKYYTRIFIHNSLVKPSF